MEENSCIVVFPVYKSLDKTARACIENGIHLTSGYKHVFVCPQSFLLDDSFSSFKEVDIIRFENHFFESKEGYNRLMLFPDFYKTFSEYKYILIHQTDAYLFKEELSLWCEKDYDYIGSPWFRPEKLSGRKFRMFMGSYFPFFYSTNRAFHFVRDNNVGNGGLSLRKVATAIQILEKASQSVLDKYKNLKGERYNEDVFWGIEAPKISKKFRKPQWREALEFAFEAVPDKSYRIIGNRLPFGCHAFEVHEPSFWKQYIHCL